VLNVGLPIYAYLLTRSVLVLSITVLLTSIPNIMLGSIAGVFVDRWDHKRTMVIVNLLLGWDCSHSCLSEKLASSQEEPAPAELLPVQPEG
jgi:MFS family permease